MTPWVMEFLSRCPRHDGKILEVGSFDVNGSCRSLFDKSDYIGTDMRAGPGVDRVIDAVDLTTGFGADVFDLVLSTDALEHILQWAEALEQMVAVAKPGGFVAVTTVKPPKNYHPHPDDYWRFTVQDFAHIFAEHQIVRLEEGKTPVGIVVQKRPKARLRLDIELFRVTPPQTTGSGVKVATQRTS